MKKTYLLLSVLLLFLINVNGQARFGIKGGANFATFLGDNTALIDSRTSIHIGAMLEVELSDVFTFQPELMYSGQGAKIDAEILDLDLLKSTTKLSYLNVPLMFKYFPAEGFNFQIGPQVGFLVGAKSDIDSDLVDASGEEDVMDLFETVDFGMNFGIGYNLNNGMTFDIRYNLGITNISSLDIDKTRNGVFQFSIGYLFN